MALLPQLAPVKVLRSYKACFPKGSFHKSFHSLSFIQHHSVVDASIKNAPALCTSIGSGPPAPQWGWKAASARLELLGSFLQVLILS